MSKKIEDIKYVIENNFTIENIEWDRSAAAFYIQEKADIFEVFEEVRKSLKDLGYIAALRSSESHASFMNTLQELAVTPQLKEIVQRIQSTNEPDVKRAWIERFFELSRCPRCSSNLQHSNMGVQCPSCYWRPYAGDSKKYVIVVTHYPQINPRSVRVNIILLILTIITTTLTGSLLWMGYQNEPFSDSFVDTMVTASTTPEFILMGALFFSLPLMIILGTHELGHYYMSKHYGVSASLPFFIPIPPGISPLGTMGAFISMREPMPNKKALFDIGIAGPIAGLIMAIPITIIGFLITEPVDTVYTAGHGPNVSIGFPLLFSILYMFFTPDGGLHPTAFAGWVGLFVTALNLLPAGQLDGGHVVRAVLGERSKYLSYATLTGMIVFGLFVYQGWLVLGLLILFIGAYHPPPLNDLTELDIKRKAVGLFSVVLLILCITPQPLVPLSYGLHVFTPETEADIQPGETVNFTIFIENTGEVNNTYDIINITTPQYWNVTMSPNNISLEAKEDNSEASRGEVTIFITAPRNATSGVIELVKIRVQSQNESSGTFGSHTPKETVTFLLHVKIPYDFQLYAEQTSFMVSPNSTESIILFVNNTGSRPLEIHVLHPSLEGDIAGWELNASVGKVLLQPDASEIFYANITAPKEAHEQKIQIIFNVMAQNPDETILRSQLFEVECTEVSDGEGKG